jgi:Trk K+ transport system NAD-binding subunit
MLFLYKLTTFRRFSRTLNRFIEKNIVARKFIKQEILEELFSLPQGYGIAQLTITKDVEEKGLSLREAGFIKKNILVLSIERDNNLVPFPHAEDTILEGDKLLCYGLLKNIKSYA